MRTSESVISRATLIVGDDPELVYRDFSELVEKIEALTVGDLERVVFQGGDCSVIDVVSSLSQSFMFSPSALIVLRDPSALSSEDSALLLTTLESYSGDNYLVLANFSGSVDAKLKSFFANKKWVIDASLKNKGGKNSFIADTVHESRLKFDPDAFRLLAHHMGEDVAQVGQVIELLKAGVGESSRIDVATLQSYLPAPGDVAPWDFTDAIEAGKVHESLEMLDRLMQAGKRHPLVIVAILQRRLVELAVASGSGINTPAQALATLRDRDKKYTKPEFVLKKILTSARRLGYVRLAQAFVWLSQADRQIKGEGGLSPELAVELLVARLAKSFSNSVG